MIVVPSETRISGAGMWERFAAYVKGGYFTAGPESASGYHVPFALPPNLQDVA